MGGCCRGRNSNPTEILVLGCESSGKSLFVRQVQCKCSGEAAGGISLTTIPTLGVELEPVVIKGKRYMFREVGGSFHEIWHKYYERSAGVMFVVDTADTVRLATAFQLLAQTLGEECLNKMPFLLVLSKRDLAEALPYESIAELLGIPGWQKSHKGPFAVVEVSATTGANVLAAGNNLNRMMERTVAMERSHRLRDSSTVS